MSSRSSSRSRSRSSSRDSHSSPASSAESEAHGKVRSIIARRQQAPASPRADSSDSEDERKSRRRSSSDDENERENGEKSTIRETDRKSGRDRDRDRDRDEEKGKERADDRRRNRDRDEEQRRDRNRDRDRDEERRRDRDRDDERRSERDKERDRGRDRGRERDSGRNGDRDRDRGRGREERNGREDGPDTSKEAEEKLKEIEAKRPARKPKMTAEQELFATRAGGAYIPPHKLRAMQEKVEDKNGMVYQRMSWDALKKSIIGLINKVNIGNLRMLVPDFFNENLVRGKGLFARALITAQQTSPTFTPVYAALLAVINTKLPENGELVLKRLILNFRRGYKRSDKTLCTTTTRFIAHLVNQQVAHEVLALQIMTLLLEKPTDDSVEVAIAFLKEVGMFLQEVSPQAKALNAIFERLRGILHEGEIDKRVQYMIEVVMEVRKAKFKDFPMVPEGLDLVEEDDQITHFLSLDEEGLKADDYLDVFRFDEKFQEHEERYKEIKRGILGESSDEESGESGSEESGESESEEEDEGEEAGQQQQQQQAVDMTGHDTVAIRRTIYLTIMSSLDFEEVCHKLIKNTLKPGMEEDLITMILECCSNERSYLKFYGLMAQRFCEFKREYQDMFEQAFVYQYNNIHRLETNRLRNVAKLFAHLLYTDAINWTVLENVHLNEDETNASSRIFIKILFQELCEQMGLAKLNERLADPFLAPYFAQLLPKDHPRKTRFAINFFTSIGLGGLTDDLREHLKNAPKLIMQQQRADAESSDSDSSDSDSSSSNSDSDSSSDSDSDSSSSESSSESEDERKTKKRRRSPSPAKKDKRRK